MSSSLAWALLAWMINLRPVTQAMVANHGRLIRIPPFPLVGATDLLGDLKGSPNRLRRDDRGITELLSLWGDSNIIFGQAHSRLRESSVGSRNFIAMTITEPIGAGVLHLDENFGCKTN
jgi:hypothetical protein